MTFVHQKRPSHKPDDNIETEIIMVLLGKKEMTINGKAKTAGLVDFYFAAS